MPKHRGGRAALAVIGLLLVAACLRSAITSVGPVLDQIGAATGLGSGALGLLAALPLLAFAGMSPLSHLAARRFGTDRMVLVSLGVLAVGLLLRSLPVPGLLWFGTLAIGVGIAVGNVLVPAVVKRDFPTHISRLTGSYTATMNTFAALASGLSVPIAAWAVGGWRTAIGIWIIPAALALIVWAARMRWVPGGDSSVRGRAGVALSGAVDVDHGRPDHAAADSDVDHEEVGHSGRSVAGRRVADPSATVRPMWRSALAWQVTLHMGLQSTVFYTLVNWLPSIEADRGVSAATSGAHLFIYQLVGIGAAFGVSLLMNRRHDQRGIAVLVVSPMIIALLGMLLLPQLVVVWVILAGMTSGSSITLALALIGLRTADASATARLSGMAQGLGYLLAAGGPIAAGAIRGLTGSWLPEIILLLALTVAQGTFGVLAGRNRTIG
ncbi:MFS transporter [Microlunatus elymi]|uniref:MFS transporter n=1 Tax=Microlunatus elymi TaxID=2596828 RepID=UPI00143CF4EC|nr:MFS transporter [Microlunatus elymi]